jgi:hypothetical protein
MKLNPFRSVVSSPFSQKQSLLFLSALGGTAEIGTTSRFALLNVCLSPRLQRGYNGVERAEFQRRE